MYKVFIKNKVLIFKKGTEKSSELFQQFGPCLSVKRFHDLISFLDDRDDALYVYTESPAETLKEFFKNFTFLKAAGGIVQSIEQPSRYLFIKRWGKWDLPKGKIEKVETPEAGAIREIKEECNVEGLQRIKKLPSTLHVYFMYEKFVVKKTHWYLFSGSIHQELVPQEEEDISEVKWFAKNELFEIKTNTYASLLDLIELIED